MMKTSVKSKASSISFAAVLLALGSVDASAASSCMTHREAREAFPRAHLYWSGHDHCWSDQRGRATARRHYRQEDDPPPVKKPPPFPLPSDAVEIANVAPPAEPGPQPEYADERLQKLADQRAGDATAQIEAELPVRAVDKPMPLPLPDPPELPNHVLRWSAAMAACVVVAVVTGFLSRRWFNGWAMS